MLRMPNWRRPRPTTAQPTGSPPSVWTSICQVLRSLPQSLSSPAVGRSYMSAPFTDVDDPKKYQWESAQNARLRLGSEGEALYSLQGAGPLATNIPKQPAELFSS